jgi:hypothetical protein
VPDPYDDLDQVPPAGPGGVRRRILILYQDQRPLAIALSTAAVSLVLVCLFAYLLVRAGAPEPDLLPETGDGDQAVEDGDTFVYEAVSAAETISITLETPAVLAVGPEAFSVQPVAPSQDAIWLPEAPDATTAVWLYGSVINYVFGIEATRDNRALLEGLALGDEIVVTTRSGSATTFAVSSREQVAVDRPDLLAQHAPGATLILLESGSASERLVVQARYVSSDVAEEVAAGRVVSLGETAQLENLQVTVNGVSYLYDRPEAPAGFAYYLIDYHLQNVGAAAVDSTELSMVLADDLGNLYALNPVASRLGNSPPLGGPIAPGQEIDASAGYQIPATLQSQTVRWQVTLIPTGSQIQVNIAFQDVVEPQQGTSVQLQEAEVSVDGTGVLLTGQISNVGTQPLVVSPDNLVLQSEGTVYLMLSTNPAFPWVIAPGESQAFAVTFQRPAGDTAIFTALNQPFQLNGLR